MTDYKIIQTINGPEDVKKLSMEQLEELASEIREALFNRLTKIGGHFGPKFRYGGGRDCHALCFLFA